MTLLDGIIVGAIGFFIGRYYDEIKIFFNSIKKKGWKK